MTASPPSGTGAGELDRRIALLVLAVLSTLFAGLGLLQAGEDSLMLDEGVYLSSGVVALAEHDLRLNPEHPPLSKVAAALPVLAATPTVPVTPAYERGDWFTYADEFMAAQRAGGEADPLIFLARLVPVGLAVLSGWMIYVVAARLGGRLAGLLGAGAWLTTPHVLGLGHFDATDLPFALTLLIVAWALLRHIDRSTDGSAAGVAAAVGVAMLTRHTGLALVPVVAVVMAVVDRRDPRTALRRLAIFAVVAWGSIWVGYRILAPGGVDGLAAANLEGMVGAAEESSSLAKLLLAVPWPLEYRAGLAYLTLTPAEAPAYLLGQMWEGSRWWYWPAILVVKLPPVTLLLLVVGTITGARLPVPVRRRLLLALVVPAVAVAVASIAPGRNIGSRYVFGPLALLLAAGAVATAAAATGAAGRRRLPPAGMAWAAVGLLGAQSVILVVSHPHSLAWTNPPFRPAYRAVTDSDVDWAQDHRRLEDFTEDQEEPVWVSLLVGSGSRPVRNTRLLRPTADPVGWVAVSASNLTAYRRSSLSWLRAYCPVGLVGRSILLYRFDEPPDRSPGPDRPAGPCGEGVTSHR